MKKANFGFKEVEETKKEKLVQNVFTTVASKYDIMNDVMSFGLHHIWKDMVIEEIKPSYYDTLLDVACGTGDISRKFLEAGGKEAYLCDLNQAMLDAGKQKMLDEYAYLNNKMHYICGNAESLPFKDNSFGYYTISFGIRNVTHIDKALKEAHRVLKKGGKFICLELCSTHEGLIRKFYDFYSFKVIPKIGKMITGSEDSYSYLVESIRKFPKPEKFSLMIENAGFDNIKYRTLTFGVVAIHTAYKVRD
ncbi:Ubiquinone/menaquinone biosynthesis methyltransferase ubiE [Candidatus Jidaibacter acanthamoeba]|uniref:Ubiquinone/menaquinone biosynthesis C-methyltransferase UbiE n=1 Tax=Candidatus Jidaibacter acanthamoebae TaxID=86105 RepID=A0A0C1MTY0_9RICK|nr:bifunctional demethylmenaquinone methyltransferase/2-methoxy-6-polyprenyl-1,4-benzoquinol methylase UbiE [Candidatus Jidaibacter acanthamoeba]KIE05552.1 Ubiquinone/menaquinone biosynthesis methyltransferase ubiE [Candidatus Jidaibacter acanthamoeba]